jgi:hypothetical protein
MGLTAPIALMYVPGRIIVRGDAAATAGNIRNLEWLLRLGIGAELFHQAIAVFLVFSLYRLFKNVDVHQARLLVALGALVSIPIMFMNTVNQIAAIVLVQGAPFLAPFEAVQRESLAYLFLHLHSRGIDVASVFWGLWLFPFGVLVIRSGFIPRLIGVLLIVAGIGYLAAAFGNLVVPAWKPVIGPVAQILEFGELPIMFWLLIWGARGERAHEPAAA